MQVLYWRRTHTAGRMCSDLPLPHWCREDNGSGFVWCKWRQRSLYTPLFWNRKQRGFVLDTLICRRRKRLVCLKICLVDWSYSLSNFGESNCWNLFYLCQRTLQLLGRLPLDSCVADIHFNELGSTHFTIIPMCFKIECSFQWAKQILSLFIERDHLFL